MDILKEHWKKFWDLNGIRIGYRSFKNMKPVSIDDLNINQLQLI